MSFLAEKLPGVPQQLVNGVAVGSVYALIALGYTMVYGILELINFAHGEIFMIGAYLAVVFLALSLPLGMPLWMALIFTLMAGIIITAAFGFTLERGAYRPLRKAPKLSPLISALGASTGLQQLVQLLQGSKAAVPARELPVRSWVFGEGGGSLVVSSVNLLIVSVTVALMIALHLFITRTRMGKAMRATAQDQTMASLLGISPDRVISATFLIGSSLAAVAGLMIALKYGKVDVMAGYIAGLKAFTSAVLGGIGNIPGAMFGGILLGIIESLGSHFIGASYKDLFAFVVLILVLIFRPSGLLGARVADKV